MGQNGKEIGEKAERTALVIALALAFILALFAATSCVRYLPEDAAFYYAESETYKAKWVECEKDVRDCLESGKAARKEIP